MQFRNMTDRQTERRTDGQNCYINIASGDKNESNVDSGYTVCLKKLDRYDYYDTTSPIHNIY